MSDLVGNPRDRVSGDRAHISVWLLRSGFVLLQIRPNEMSCVMRKPAFFHMRKTKTQISFMICAFVFAT